MAVLIAVVVTTTLGGVQTASAFNPQPEPPGNVMPDDGTWCDALFDIETGFMTAIGTAVNASGSDEPVGITFPDMDPGSAPGLNLSGR